MRNNYRLILLLLVFTVAGCMATPQPPVMMYTLNPELENILTPGGQAPASQSIIRIGRISSAQALQRHDILYISNGHQQNSYAYSKWSDAPAAMMLGLFQQALEMSGEFSAVLPPASRARPDLVLEGALFDFSHHIENNGTSSGVIRLSVNLVDNRTKQVIASKALSASVPARAQNAESAVAALNDAAASIVRQLLEWLNTELAKGST